MKSLLKPFSIRIRLLTVYIAILLIGFSGLTLIVGQQISSGARQDYEQRLKSEILLIAQGVSPIIDGYMEGRQTEADMHAALAEYENQLSGTLTLISLREQPGENEGRMSFRGASELEGAIRGEIVLDERHNEFGEDTLYTAAPVVYDGRLQGLLQLSVPASNLRTIIAQRWLELGLIATVVALLGIGASFWLANTIIHPLYRLRESAVRLSEGDLSHRIAYAKQDEIGEVAQAFNEMAKQVENMLEEQRAFASNASHELRTPLTSIRLRTEALRYDRTLEADLARRYIEEIDDAVARLGNLVQDLTLLSRLDAGRAELGHEQVNMLRFSTSLRDQMLPIAQDKNIDLLLEQSDDSLMVDASLNHLIVVFRNLLDNALKYTPAGGKITWTIERTDAGIQHTIADTGRGIAADNLPHVFERFYRVDKAHSQDVPGTGLGLALVKSIIEAYGGQIAIWSAGIDRGTTATVILPQHMPSSDERSES